MTAALPPALADTDWTTVVSTVGSALVLVIGAIGFQVYRVKSARWAFERDGAAAAERAAAGRKAGERRDRKDTIGEYQELLEIKEKDVRDWRAQVHALRGEMLVLSNRLAVCEWDRTRLQAMIEDQGEALQRANIPVHYRPAPAHPVPERPAPDSEADAGADGGAL